MTHRFSDSAEHNGWLAALEARDAEAWSELDRALAEETTWAREALILALREPRPWAWHYLYDRYATEVARRSRRFLNSQADAEACAADVLFDFVMHYAESPNALAKFPGYLWAMADTYALKRSRRERRSLELLTQAGRGDATARYTDWDDFALRMSLERRFAARLEAALAALSERDRDLLKMRIHEDLSFSQIGRARGYSPQAAHKAYERILDELRRACGVELRERVEA